MRWFETDFQHPHSPAESMGLRTSVNRCDEIKSLRKRQSRDRRAQTGYTFPSGSAPTPPDGRECGKSSSATPLRSSAIP